MKLNDEKVLSTIIEAFNHSEDGIAVVGMEDGRLVYRQVHIARREPEYVIVDGGLKNGDLLVVEMLQGVSPGMLASPKPHNAAGKSS